MQPIPLNIPNPLSAFLNELREIKRLKVEAGYRHTSTNAREALEFITRRHLTRITPIPLVRDEIVPGPDYDVPVRLYHPAPDEPLPLALFVHGGGHVSGSVSLYDPIARALAVTTRHLVVSVEYRLAPECPYPRALVDLIACIKGIVPVLHAVRPALAFVPRLSLIGDSGGGALCASAAHLTQFDPGVAIERLALIYPSLDYTLSKPSVTENGEGLLLERQRILWYFDSYFQRAENRREVSPLFMPLTPGYPPTLLATAEFCPLRDEGIAYVQRLREHQIPAEHIHYPGLVHAFLNLEDLVPGACADLYRHIGDFLDGSPATDEGD